jgi:hypothetical protein
MKRRSLPLVLLLPLLGLLGCAGDVPPRNGPIDAGTSDAPTSAADARPADARVVDARVVDARVVDAP